jgi:hypothetical protein
MIPVRVIRLIQACISVRSRAFSSFAGVADERSRRDGDGQVEPAVAINGFIANFQERAVVIEIAGDREAEECVGGDDGFDDVRGTVWVDSLSESFLLREVLFDASAGRGEET